jgi:hypothetical protein
MNTIVLPLHCSRTKQDKPSSGLGVKHLSSFALACPVLSWIPPTLTPCHQINALKKAEVRRQRAEGTLSLGIQTPTNCKHRVDDGVLDPCSFQSRADVRSQYSLQHSCLLPSAFLDNLCNKYFNLLPNS